MRSKPKTLPEHCGEQREPFLLPLNCLHRDMGWRSHVLAEALMDGPISEFLSLPACSFLPLLTCAAATHQRWGHRGTQWGTDHRQLSILLRKTQAGNPGSHASAAYLIISNGIGRSGVAFCPPLPGCNDRSICELLHPSAWSSWHKGLDSFKKRRWR